MEEDPAPAAPASLPYPSSAPQRPSNKFSGRTESIDHGAYVQRPRIRPSRREATLHPRREVRRLAAAVASQPTGRLTRMTTRAGRVGELSERNSRAGPRCSQNGHSNSSVSVSPRSPAATGASQCRQASVPAHTWPERVARRSSSRSSPAFASGSGRPTPKRSERRKLTPLSLFAVGWTEAAIPGIAGHARSLGGATGLNGACSHTPGDGGRGRGGGPCTHRRKAGGAGCPQARGSSPSAAIARAAPARDAGRRTPPRA